METTDNTGGAGQLTLSAFTAPAGNPVPEPRSTVLFLVAFGGIVIAQRTISRSRRQKECKAS
jgi:hypothetical protein